MSKEKPSAAIACYSPALENLDQSAIFLAYLTFMGDIAKTALATNAQPHLIAQLEAREDWKAKLVNLQTFKEKGDSGGFEQAVNRTVNFVQAVRLRRLIDLALRQMLENPTPEAVFTYFQSFDKQGNRVTNVRPLMDLVKAAETAQHMTYRALGDKAEDAISSVAGTSPQSQAMSMQRALAALNAIPGETSVNLVGQELRELSDVEIFDPRGTALEKAIKVTKPGETPPGGNV